MDLEAGLLSLVVQTNNIKFLIEQKITPEFFYGQGKLIYEFILQHYRLYKKTPSTEAIQKEFQGFSITQVVEPVEYYVDQLRNRHRHNLIVQGLNDIAEQLENEKTVDAEERLFRLASKLSTEIRVTRDINYSENAEERKARYLQKKMFQGVDGIPTHIEPLDAVTGGAHGGELITLLGQPGVGKTWVELVIARAALRSGYRVLFITKEMEPEQIALRMDAAILGFTFDKLRRGVLGNVVEVEYFDALERLKTTYQDFVISGDSGEGGVMSIQAKIEEHNPDLVIIDGSYLIVDDDGGKSQYERATNITRALKRLARSSRLPIYNSTQAGRQVKRGGAPTMEDVSFTYAYAQDSDVIISLYRSQEMQVAGKMGLKLTKVREGSSEGHFLLEWDFENMKTFGTLATNLSGVSLDEDNETVIY